MNGKRFDKEIIFHEIGEYLDDDYDEEELEKILSQGGFEKPEPTDDNPYSVPGDILLGEDEYLKPITGFCK